MSCPASVWPLASYLADEMEARQWTAVDVASRMAGDYPRNIILVNLILSIQHDNMIIEDEVFDNLGSAFGLTATMLKNLHRYWIDCPKSREPFKCPEHLLDGLVFPDQESIDA